MFVNYCPGAMLSMRKGLIYSIFVAILVVFSSSCEKDQVNFYIFKEHDFEITAGLNTIETHFFVFRNIKNTLPQELYNQGLSFDDVKQVYAGKGLIKPVFEDFQYGDIREVSIWVVSPVDPSIRQEIYYQDQIPYNLRGEMRLLSGIANLKEFLSVHSTYNLEIQIKFRNFVPANSLNRFTYSFAIFLNNNG